MSNIGMPRRGESHSGRKAVAEPPSLSTPDDLQAEAAFFRACGIGKPSVARAIEGARTNGTSVESELIAARLIKPDIYYRWLAQYLELPFLDRIDPRSILAAPSIDALLRRHGPLRIVDRERLLTVISPSAATLQRERCRLAERPALRSRLAVASPAAIRAAVWSAGEAARVRCTTSALEEKRREHSARTVLTGFQGFCIGLALCALIAVSLAWPVETLVGVHLTMTAFFLSASLLRLLAAAFGKRPDPPTLPRDTKGLPVYTILVALKDEAEVAGQLVRALERIDWPKARLDIKFICEKSDTATVAALRAANPGPQCEIIFVPDYGPRTKPKALAYGMAGARGDYVALYDAEDIPAPAQLREAFAIFSASDGKVGCVQAPLVVSNFRTNWLSALFAIEYAGLFRALVPFLGRWELPIPLGGTSNHFRRSVLEEVGGWDPYNVTEDADLGPCHDRNGARPSAGLDAPAQPVAQGLASDLAGDDAPSVAHDGRNGGGGLFLRAGLHRRDDDFHLGTPLHVSVHRRLSGRSHHGGGPLRRRPARSALRHRRHKRDKQLHRLRDDRRDAHDAAGEASYRAASHHGASRLLAGDGVRRMDGDLRTSPQGASLGEDPAFGPKDGRGDTCVRSDFEECWSG